MVQKVTCGTHTQKQTHRVMTIPVAYHYVQNKGSRLIKSDKCNKQTAKPIIYSGIKLKKK